ncbi:hypothetical protein ACRALDRAFT_2035685 [Sodiomyces alcalophilus JCM 7366]|uniref:uncharacterized protein n=1 Tax=Sodiomyces alcalophilus JCM 7366 TaxID=591952 RepID=UPI0039B603EA
MPLLGNSLLDDNTGTRFDHSSPHSVAFSQSVHSQPGYSQRNGTENNTVETTEPITQSTRRFSSMCLGPVGGSPRQDLAISLQPHILNNPGAYFANSLDARTALFSPRAYPFSREQPAKLRDMSTSNPPRTRATRTYSAPSFPPISPHAQPQFRMPPQPPPLSMFSSYPTPTTPSPQSQPYNPLMQAPTISSSATTTRPPPNPLNLSAEENVFIYQRLPMRSPATAETVLRHFQRRRFVYLDLAEATEARVSDMAVGSPGRERKVRVAQLARRISKKWERRRSLSIPASRIEAIIQRHRGEERLSVFWTKVLDEVEV